MTPNGIYNRNVQACAAELQSFGLISTANAPSHTHSYTIEPCKTAVPSDYYDYLCNPPMQINQEGEEPMCYNSPKTGYNSAVAVMAAPAPIEATQRDFFSARINQVRREHEETLRTQFHLDDEEGPRTAKDLVKKITEGDFTFDEKLLDRVDPEELKYYNNTYGIRWGKNAPDKEGFKVAQAALKTASQDAIDAGSLSAADGLLQILKDFQAWTYAPKAEKAKK